jgi:AraC-like DNA-binding protein
VEVSRVGYATSLWHGVHGYHPDNPLRQWKAEGRSFDCILGILRNERSLELARELAPHVISLSSILPLTDNAWHVVFDAKKIGTMAGDYFLKNKIAAGAFFCTEPDHVGLMARGDAFAETLAASKVPFLGNFSDANVISSHALRAVKGTVGFFAADDQAACHLSAGFSRNGVPVPYKAMILGVNDQDYLCHFGPVPLSSIRLDGEGMGRACVDLLKAIATGSEGLLPRNTFIPPLGVTVRASTSAALVGDDLASRALSKLRQAEAVPVNVEEWARLASTSRRPLERALKQVLNRTPKQFLDAERVRRARHLLRTSHHTMEGVAELAGFSSARHLRETLIRLEGSRPSEIRGGSTSRAIN